MRNWRIAQSPKVEKLFIAPGNAGTSAVGENVSIKATDFPALKAFALEQKIDMIVVGPEDPLVEGIYDSFTGDASTQHIAIIGPTAKGAQLEGSKEFAKGFMERHGIPTARYKSITAANLDEGLAFLETLEAPYVLKADGLCAGKGVLILPTLEEAKRELEEMLGSNALDFVIDNYHYDSILYNKELYCEENILLAVPKHFAVNEELGMYQLSYKNIKNKNYLNQKYPAVPLGRFADLPFIMLTQGNDTRTRGDRLCRNVGFKPNIVLEFNQQSTAYMASSTQLGATFISDILVSQLPTFENLVYYKLDGEEAKRKVFFYYKTHKYKTRVMEEFVRMMHEQI